MRNIANKIPQKESNIPDHQTAADWPSFITIARICLRPKKYIDTASPFAGLLFLPLPFYKESPQKISEKILSPPGFRTWDSSLPRMLFSFST